MLVMPSFIAAVGGVDAVYFSFGAQHVTFFVNDKKVLYFWGEMCYNNYCIYRRICRLTERRSVWREDRKSVV